MWNKEIGIDFWREFYNFKGLYITPKKMKEIILNDYMQNIYFDYDEILFFLEKNVMDNNYNCN